MAISDPGRSSPSPIERSFISMQRIVISIIIAFAGAQGKNNTVSLL